MCGFVGAVGQRDILPNLIEGLKLLEYRGYDSCGVSVLHDCKLVRSRSVERFVNSQDEIAKRGLARFTGIASYLSGHAR
jgi:glucosamine--fructose-6-phosphate aminotransferase (isomerizing)